MYPSSEGGAKAEEDKTFEFQGRQVSRWVVKAQKYSLLMEVPRIELHVETEFTGG